jgi:hypothetical protein
MVDMIQTSCDYRTKLDKSMTAFSLFIHDLCPDGTPGDLLCAL